MNKDQKLEALRSKITELLPDLMELKFGCWIKINPKNLESNIELKKYIESDPDHFNVFQIIDWEMVFCKKDDDGAPYAGDDHSYAILHQDGVHFHDVKDLWKDDFDILGQTITIASVLRAIRKLPINLNPLRTIGTKLHPLYRENTIIKSWTLEQDDLNLQDEATITLLHNILCQ